MCVGGDKEGNEEIQKDVNEGKRRKIRGQETEVV